MINLTNLVQGRGWGWKGRRLCGRWNQGFDDDIHDSGDDDGDDDDDDDDDSGGDDGDYDDDDDDNNHNTGADTHTPYGTTTYCWDSISIAPKSKDYWTEEEQELACLLCLLRFHIL